MASGGFKCNKPELVAIYRLEFYKNKKKWKFCNERKESPQPSSKGTSSKTARRDKLNETYKVEPSWDSEKESSPLNNAFMHEIPTDDTPPEEDVIPPPPPSQPGEDVWARPGLPPGPKPSYPISTNSGVAASSQSQRKAQTPRAFTNKPQAAASQVHNVVGLDSCVAPSQQSARITLCTDQHQSDVDLKWLLGTSGRTPATSEHTDNQQSTQEPWQSACNSWNNEQTPAKNPQSQGLWTKPPPTISNSQPRSQHMPSAVSPTGPRHFNSSPWDVPPPPIPVPPHNKEMLADLLKSHSENYIKQGENLPQSPPANCLQMLLCPDTWNKQATPSNQKYQDEFPSTGSAMNPDAAPVTEPLQLRNRIRPDSFANVEKALSAPPPYNRRLVSETLIDKQSVPPPEDWTKKQGIVTPGMLTNRQNVPPPDTWPDKQSIPAPDTYAGNQNNPPPGNWTNKYSVPSPCTLTNKQSVRPPDNWTEKQSIPAPDTYNPSMPPPGNWTNKYKVPSPDTLTHKYSEPPPDYWTEKQSVPPSDTWTNEIRKGSQYPCQEPYNYQRGSTRPSQLVTPGDVLQGVHQEPKIKAPPPTPEGCPTEPWYDLQKVQNAWINPAQYANLEEIQQNFWTHQAWQKEDVYINQDWAPPASDDVPDGAGEEAFAPYSPADQNTLREACSLEPGEGEGEGSLSPEQVRRGAARWLARLLQLYAGPHDQADAEAAGDHAQSGLDESVEFIRAAHDVPHSSEKDFNETRELCACVAPVVLPSLPARRLTAALRHAARHLRDVLGEQILRDRLRTQTLQNMVEHPTRDTGLFPRELVVGGSHVARGAPGALGQAGHVEGPERLIRIAMGRPYRL